MTGNKDSDIELLRIITESVLPDALEHAVNDFVIIRRVTGTCKLAGDNDVIVLY